MVLISLGRQTIIRLIADQYKIKARPIISICKLVVVAKWLRLDHPGLKPLLAWSLVIHCINLLTIIRPTPPNHNVETGKSLVVFGGLMAALGPKHLASDAHLTEKVSLMITPSKLLL